MKGYLESHGGNIYRFMEERNLSTEGIIDFSASINPLGVPESVTRKIKENINYLCHYPDPDAKQLTLKLARHYNIEPNSIICGNGSTELIYLTVRTLRPKKVLMLAPTFSEYERACKISNKSQVTSCKLKKENNFAINPDEFISAMSGNINSSLVNLHSSRPFDMAFLCNPNNPTGRLMKKDEVLKIADAAKQLKCYLVVDEAFIDFTTEESVVHNVKKNPYLIVLRSMTKFYALSGLRLGFGIFPSDLIKILKKHKEPWTVNTAAQLAGITALNDSGYINKTFELMKNEKKALEDGFKLLGISYFPSSANFYLIRHDNAKKIITVLRNKGLLVRDCSNFKGLDSSYMRVAVKSKQDNMRLIEELSNFLKNCLPEFNSGAQEMLKQVQHDKIESI